MVFSFPHRERAIVNIRQALCFTHASGLTKPFLGTQLEEMLVLEQEIQMQTHNLTEEQSTILPLGNERYCYPMATQ